MKDINIVFERFPILQTESFILREAVERDFKSIYEIYSDLEAVKYQQINPMDSIEQAEKSINAFINGFKNKKFIRWCIALKDNDKVIGLITLHSIDPWNSNAEIGYMLNRNYWRMGVMSEAAKSVIDFAFKEMELNRIEASIHPENNASIKLSLKLGFEKEGLKKQASYNIRTGDFEDRLVFGIVKSS